MVNVFRALGERVLWMHAKDYVREHSPHLIGVAGSFGKTMTKDAIARALSAHKHVRAAPASYNTRIGVALSVLGVGPASSRLNWIKLLARSKAKEMSASEPDVIVLEVGADRPGDVDFVARNLPFATAVVAGVGSAHLRLFGTKEMVAHEVASLPVSLPEGGRAVLNGDDPLVRRIATHLVADAIFYGQSEDASVRLVRAERTGVPGFAVEIAVDGRHHELFAPNIVSRSQLWSILAAIAVAKAVVGDAESALDNVKNIQPPPGRMRVLEGKNGARVLDDSYNANPEGMNAALSTLEAVTDGRRIAILGDMRDLGGSSHPSHSEAGRRAAEVVDILITVGMESRTLQAAALDRARESGWMLDAHHFMDAREVGPWIAHNLAENDTVLIKGSRPMRLERAVRDLLAHPERDREKLVEEGKTAHKRLTA